MSQQQPLAGYLSAKARLSADMLSQIGQMELSNRQVVALSRSVLFQPIAEAEHFPN
jgi:hypothetical protein